MGHSAPSIDVIYSDTSTGTLRCRILAADTTASYGPVTTAQNTGMPLFLEFDRPTKSVLSAKMSMTVTEHWSGNTMINVFLLDPPLNSEPITDGSGLASLAGPLDAGLSGVRGMLGSQQYTDGTQLSDFVTTGLNTSNETYYDPAIWGGVQDLTKWPHKDAGKWITGANYLSGVNIVASSYSGE